jgi:hypothetical protein
MYRRKVLRMKGTKVSMLAGYMHCDIPIWVSLRLYKGLNDQSALLRLRRSRAAAWRPRRHARVRLLETSVQS